MSLKLRIASLWTPKSMLIQELDRVSDETTGALDRLLRQYAPNKLDELKRKDIPMNGKLEERRAAMASAHNSRVQALVDQLGLDKAIKIGRKSLYKVGLKLGFEARKRLGVSDDEEDLFRAARILYKVLGISFRVNQRNARTILCIDRCALSNYYSKDACHVLSAADEGVVKGLNSNVDMVFKERITAGAPECIADLKFDKEKVERK